MTDLSALARPSGGFAMLAVDQREALRLMFAGDVPPEPDGSVPGWVRERYDDDTLRRFKLRATELLSPYASGVLVDKQFGLDAVLDAGAVAPGCGLIAAADEFIHGDGETVRDSVLDERIDAAALRARSAVALKLLVVWRPDEPPEPRIAMVRRFVRRCQDAGLLSIIEPVSRAPRSGGDWNWNDGVLAAARELGALGADLYKAEVPLHGKGSDDEVRRDCARLGEHIDSPWVVLSSGVPAEEFPRAVRLACTQGASGFLAGRAVWRSCVGAADLDHALRTEAVPRLRQLAEIVDDSVTTTIH